MDFITFTDLSNDVVKNISRIPRDIDLVVGVPRSGMLVATLIGLYLNKPIADVKSVSQKRLFSTGITKKKSWTDDFNAIKKILLCEDSVCSGASINNAIKTIKESFKGDVISLAAYIVPNNKHMVDIYFREINVPRFFEWNYLHHEELKHSCFDMDGVLCVDPTEEENDNGEKYINFILNSPPKLIPSQKIGYIVTSRLESYRNETEQWLKKYNIEYGQLIMYPGSFEQRVKKGNHANYKAKVYKSIKDALLFVESEPKQASKIREITGKQVYCVSDTKIFRPSLFYSVKQKAKQKIPDSIFGIPISKKARSVLHKIED